MFKDLFRKKINILYLITLLTIVFIGNDVYASSNNSQNDLTRGSTQETTNDSNNSNIISHILNPNRENRMIDITGSVTISLFENNSQQFDNYPVYRVSHNERKEGNNENVEYFVMREDTIINFLGRSNDRETGITFQDGVMNHLNSNNIRPSLIFRDGTFRVVLGTNIFEVNDFDVWDSATVNLVATINSGRLMSGIRGVDGRGRPTLDIDGILNIILDESSIANMEANRAYPVIFGFGTSNVYRNRIRFNNNNRRIISYSLNNDYYISLNSNNIETNNIRYIIQNLNDDSSIDIRGSVTISQFDNHQIFAPVLSLLRDNYQRFNDYPLFRIIHNEERENNNENISVIDGFLATKNLRFYFEGQSDRETRITFQDGVINHFNSNNIRSSLNFRDGTFRFGLGSNIFEVNGFDVYSSATVNLMIAINNEGIIGGLRGVGDRPRLDIDGILNIILDESSIANMEENRYYQVLSGFDMLDYFRDEIRLVNNDRRLIGRFDENGNYVILNSGLSFTGWQLNSMSTQLQFVSNLNPEVSNLSGSEGRYSMYYVNENTHNTNRLDYITSSDDDMEEEQGQDFAIQAERVRNFLRNPIRVNRYITTIIEAAINGTEEDNENTTPLTITTEDNRVEEVEDNNENNNENINMHTVITNNARDNSNDTSYGHFDDLFTIFSDSTAVEEEEEN